MEDGGARATSRGLRERETLEELPPLNRIDGCRYLVGEEGLSEGID